MLARRSPRRFGFGAGVADTYGVEQVVVGPGAALEAEPREVGQQLRVDDRDVGDLAALAADADLAALEVDVAPAQETNLLLSQAEGGQGAIGRHGRASSSPLLPA